MGKILSHNLRLGALVLIGTIFLIIAMYLIGDKQHLFGSTFQLRANFKNVNGLMVGNNVRFAVLFDNLSSKCSRKVNYSAVEINKAEEDVWVVYPWER